MVDRGFPPAFGVEHHDFAKGMTPMKTLTFSLAAAAAMLAWTSPASAADPNWIYKMFSEREHNFGVVAHDSDVRHRIEIHNPYKTTFTIANVGTTCGCTAGTPSAKTIPSGQSAFIEVTMNTHKFKGQKDSNVDVTLAWDGHTSTVRIPIHAYIREDIVLQPNRVDFGNVAMGQPAQKAIEVLMRNGNERITGVRAPEPFLKASVKEAGRSNGETRYQVLVELAPNAPEGTLDERIMLTTSSGRQTSLPVSVVGHVEPDIVVATPTVQLGTLVPGQERTARVVIRGHEPFVIESVKSQSGGKTVQADVAADAKNVHVVPIRVNVPDRPGQFSEDIQVRIAGRDKPVTFHAEGNIAAAPAGSSLTTTETDK